GIKYYKITGKTDDKQPYCPKAALETAAVHAGNFMFNREKQVEYLCLHMDREPIIVAPYDAELFGHWWFEGPQWLEYLIRKVAFDQQTIKLGTPGEYLKRYPVNQVAQPSMSSWGFNGYSEVWLDDANDWIYRHLSMIAKTMGELANAETGDDLIRRALNQAAREVLLAQSSDWAFIMKAGTMTEYAVMRTCQHIQRFWQLEQQIRSGRVDQHYLSEVEGMDNIFPNLDYRVFRQTTAAEIMAQIS
ncbi:MAG: 1,4-alpha-glucan branching protein domain-containing protein, partial [Limnochordia bacterium]